MLWRGTANATLANYGLLMLGRLLLVLMLIEILHTAGISINSRIHVGSAVPDRVADCLDNGAFVITMHAAQLAEGPGIRPKQQLRSGTR
jgi:hypothetical protein